MREYRPELILVSAGFDTWQHDPARRHARDRGGLRRPLRPLPPLGGRVLSRADRLRARGGYDPDGLVAGVRAALRALAAPEAPEAHVEGDVSDVIRDRFRGRRRGYAPPY